MKSLLKGLFDWSMSSTKLDDHIADEELLYRGVPMNPNQWSFERNTPSSAAFKDSLGVPVDRDRNRKEIKRIASLTNRLVLRAVVSVTAKQCRETNAHLQSDPVDGNPYHALVLHSEKRNPLTSGQARFISRQCRVAG